jgi:drug/metabolite transporter (DMT)-like permease
MVQGKSSEAFPSCRHCPDPALLGTFYIAIFGSVIGFLFWPRDVTDLGPACAGQFVHLIPLFGAALSFVFLDEPLSIPQVLSASFVLFGIVLKKKNDNGT